MLDTLMSSLETVHDLLADTGRWQSLIINRRKPHTFRASTILDNGLRVCLHKFNVCDEHEAHPHPHPWPGAFLILQGSYKMLVGRSQDREASAMPILPIILTRGSAYEISDPLVWHSVVPLETTYTIMVNGPAWDPGAAHIEVRTTKGKDLESMPENELREHLELFQDLIRPFAMKTNPGKFWPGHGGSA